MNLPLPGLQVLLSADNVDGVNNELISHGEKIPSWTQLISGGPKAFDTSHQPGLKTQPTLFTCADETVVNFDGVTQSLICPGSTAGAFAQLHGGPCDVLFVFRPNSCAVNATGVSTANPKRVWGNGDGITPGMTLSQEDSGHAGEGVLHLDVFDGTTLHSLDLVSKVPELARWSKLLVRSDGAKLGGSFDFSNFDSMPYTPIPGAAGHDFLIGAHLAADTYFATWGGDVLFFALYNRNLSNDELVQVNAEIARLLGGEV